MEDLVDGVVSSDDPDVADDPGGEVEVLPGAAVVLGVVHHAVPVVLVHGEVHHVGVGPPGFPVPQEDPQVVDDALGPQLDNNAPASGPLSVGVVNGMPERSHRKQPPITTLLLQKSPERLVSLNQNAMLLS